MNPVQGLRQRAPADGGRPRESEQSYGAGIDRRATALLLTAALIVVTLVVGWLVWSAVEWRHGRTPALRLTGLRVVRASDKRRAGFWRMLLREICCLVLVVPTVLACTLLACVFLMGASPPEGVLQARRAPWDVLSGTDVVSATPPPRRRVAPPLGEFPVDRRMPHQN